MSSYQHPDPSETRQEQAKTLLKAVYGSSNDDLVVNTFVGGFTTRSFTTNEMDLAVAHSMRLSTSQCVYFGTGLRNRVMAPGERGAAEDIGNLNMLWTELDIFDPLAHKKGSELLPSDMEAALGVIDAYCCPPIGLVDSGHGLHGYWRLREPLLITDAKSLADAKVLVHEFQNAFNTWAGAQFGFKFDSTHDLARVMWVPGTVNHKVPADPKPVRLLRWDDGVAHSTADIPRLPVSAASKHPKSESVRTAYAKIHGGTPPQVRAMSEPWRPSGLP